MAGETPEDARLQPPAHRRKFAWNLDEVSGALGDLGTFLPHIIGAITVVGMSPTGIFVCFGLFYALAGGFYGIPMAVQPMKAASAAVLIKPMSPGAVAGAGLVVGAFFLIAGSSGLIGRIARALPPTVAAGLQLGLGLSLAGLGIRFIEHQPWLGLAMCVLMLVLMRIPRMPVALIAVVLGAIVGVLTGASPAPPPLQLGLHLPHLIWPSWAEVEDGVIHAVLPQIPLTLTNAIIVTAAVSRQLFPGEGRQVNERNLAITTGLGNLLAAPFGGYLMCHGAGGMAGHYRFGARTATAPVLLGVVLVALGLLLGSSGYQLLRTIPDAVLGGLLLFSGVDLALSSRPGDYKDAELFLVLLMAAIGVAVNPAAAFAVGLPLAFAFKHRWLKI
ncbi:MAG TPA: putative sulfate/molybdate transporter [Caulobacteraceae bacterium]|nr:putative sulfate/molybdate transporter [Caulobacteraceae bacterium]